MKSKLLEKLAITLLPRLLELAVKIVEEYVKFDLDQDGKIGRK